MSRILVTGASGFIGRHVIDAAIRRGYEVLALVRNGRPCGEPRDGVFTVKGDVRDAAAIRSAVEGCHAVIHVAALYSFDSSLAAEMHEVNVGGTENVLRLALEAGVDRIVYTGTVGGTAFASKGLATERDMAGQDEMTGPYKLSKFEAERIVRAMAAQGAPVVTVCPTAPIGPGDEKPTPTGRIVRDFMRRRMPAYIDTGLNFVHVADVAEGHLLALERGKDGERYLLGNMEGNLTLRQAFDILSELTGVPAPRLRLPHSAALAAAHISGAASRLLSKPSPIPLEPVRMAKTRMWVDPSWSVRELGMPQTPVRQAFRDALQWYSGRHGSGCID